MDNYIELTRTFTTLDDGADSYDRSFEFFSWGNKNWDDLLEMPRVVIHARAGFGKSLEMEHMANKLYQEGKNAFYIRLEDLKSERLNNYFWGEQAERFTHWLSSNSEPAWLFLDSVDELKLTHTKLETALRNVARVIPPPKQADIHIYLSSRPSDWSNHVEQPAFEKLLPFVPKPLDKEETLHCEKLYLEVLSGQWQGKPVEEDSEKLKVQYFNLTALNRDQVTVYVEAKLGHQAQDFLTLLNREYAWDLAACPMDLDALIAYWRKKGKLGTRLEQYRHLCEERLAENTLGRNEGRRLSPDKVLMGAEKLALSLVLTQTGSSVSFAGYTDGSVDILSAREALSDWSEAEVKELLRSALFDPATHDSVRFAHRSMREYLAAQCLKRLLGNHFSFPSLEAELFKQQYGEQVIPHSLKPIVAWLSVLDERFFDLAVDNYPEVLMSDGAPDSYRLEQKQRLITSFTKKYATHERVMNTPLEFASRLAEPELATTLNNLWSQYGDCPDFRELTLELIEAGRITDCIDIAYTVAQDENMLAGHISRAIYALEACEASEELFLIAKLYLDQKNDFPDTVIISSLSVLFPSYLKPHDLIVLIKTINPSESTKRSRLTRELQAIANHIDPMSNSARQLRSLLSSLIFRSIEKGSRGFHPSSPYQYLASVLLILCYRQLIIRHITIDNEILWGCVIANKLLEDKYSDRKTKVEGVLLSEINLGQFLLRKDAYLVELEFVKSLQSKDDSWSIFHRLRSPGSFIFPFQQNDWEWLIALFQAEQDELIKQVITWSLHTVWLERGASEQEKEILKSYVLEVVLEQDMKFLFEPAKEDPREKQWRSEDQALARKMVEQEHKKQQGDIAWRANLLAAPTQLLEDEEALFKIYNWLQVYRSEYSDIAWDKAALADAFSEEVANVAEQAFQKTWQEVDHTFWSERDRDSYFRIKDRTKLALTGLYIFTRSDGWELQLAEQDVDKAVRLMLLELDAFEESLKSIHTAHSEQVVSLIADEVVAQLAFISERPDLPLVIDLYKLAEEMSSSVSSKLLEWLEGFIDSPSSVHSMASDRITDVFDFISRTDNSDQLKQAANLCSEWLSHSPDIPLEKVLFTALLKLDRKKALNELINRLEQYQEKDAQRGAQLFSSLFGNNDFVSLPASSELIDELKDLLKLSYQLNSKSNSGDVTDGGCILSSLIRTSGAEAYRALKELSEWPEFTHIQNRIKIWASNRAATDTEERKFSIDEVKRSFIAKEFIPNDRDSLYEAVLNKLNEVEHYLRNDDYSNIEDWRNASEEKPIQRLLADRLNERRSQLFSIERETEVFDKKEPDIRITAPDTDVKAVVEIKHGDKGWSLADLEETLEIQIVGQYLRSDSCRAGVLFVTYHGEKHYWEFDGKRKSFADLITRLQCKAKELEKEHSYVFRLGVFGLDLTEF